jgi:hypothetical protein
VKAMTASPALNLPGWLSISAKIVQKLTINIPFFLRSMKLRHCF